MTFPGGVKAKIDLGHRTRRVTGETATLNPLAVSRTLSRQVGIGTTGYAGSNSQNGHGIILECRRPLDRQPGTGQ
jgi:hypothetical protein